MGFLGSIHLGWLLPFLFVIIVVVFFHELGHFLVARWCGVAVQTFSIGFGPELIGRTDRHGTRWRISAIPLGGYVKFLGDDNVASAGNRELALTGMDPAVRARSFIGQSVGRRAAIVAAGPIANFILAIVIFTVFFTAAGRLVTPPIVDSLVEDGGAIAAGIEVGDRILSISGRPIESFSDISRSVGFAAGRPLSVVVERGGEEITLTVTPTLERAVDPLGNPYNVGRLGVGHTYEEGESFIQRYSVPRAFVIGVNEVWYTISTTLGYLGRVIAGRESLDQLGGPVTVARVAERAASESFTTLVSFAAFISISIGFVNLLPIPLLDGGHLLFYGIEAVRRRPLSPRAQEIALRVGMVLVLALLFVALRNDLVSLFRVVATE
ncbi:MAG: RIP metalloprotease [Bauldia sp.]|nr:RIP metalloprotease [Bauldia sp.]MCW5718988.1 RIP metalloprotease [Bauldia sp.]